MTKNNSNNKELIEEKFILTVSGKAIKINDIAYFKAERSYCNVHLINKESYIVSKHLGNFEDLLPENIFFRCHKSFLVNIGEIDYCLSEKGKIILKNKKFVKLSRTKTAKFKQKYVI